jgi:hypothetical protein
MENGVCEPGGGVKVRIAIFDLLSKAVNLCNRTLVKSPH